MKIDIVQAKIRRKLSIQAMLVLTTNALENGNFPDLSAWQGPRALIILPGSGITASNRMGICRDYIVLEFLQPIHDSAERLIELFTLPIPLLQDAEWPLLYLDRPHDSRDPIESRSIDPVTVSGQITSEGHLARLALGDMILSSPLLPELLHHLRGRKIDDATFLALLDEGFTWKSA